MVKTKDELIPRMLDFDTKTVINKTVGPIQLNLNNANQLRMGLFGLQNIVFSLMYPVLYYNKI